MAGRLQSVEDCVAALTSGEATLIHFPHHSKTSTSWVVQIGVGTNHTFWLDARELRDLRRRVHLVETEESYRTYQLIRGGQPFSREYAAA